MDDLLERLVGKELSWKHQKYSQAVQILKLLLWTDGPVCIQCFIPPMMWSRQNVSTFTKQHSSLSKDAGATSGLAALPSAPEIAMVTRDNFNSSWKWQVLCSLSTRQIWWRFAKFRHEYDNLDVKTWKTIEIWIYI